MILPIKILNWASTKAEPTAEKNLEYAPCIMARDWKGFANYGSPAVLVGGKDDARTDK